MTDHETNPDWEPLEPKENRAQISALLTLLDSHDGARVLDLGCGSGRVLVPLVQAGHELVGVDTDPEALEACNKTLARVDFSAGSARLLEVDYIDNCTAVTGEFDVVLCLGHNFMAVVHPEDAVALLKNIATMLKPGGQFIIDNIPGEFWPRVIEGDWVSGVSDEGTMQLAWARDDNVFVLRVGDDISDDDDGGQLKPDEPHYRLWTMGELWLLAHAAGLTPPQVNQPGHLISFGVA